MSRFTRVWSVGFRCGHLSAPRPVGCGGGVQRSVLPYCQQNNIGFMSTVPSVSACSRAPSSRAMPSIRATGATTSLHHLLAAAVSARQLRARGARRQVTCRGGGPARPVARPARDRLGAEQPGGDGGPGRDAQQQVPTRPEGLRRQGLDAASASATGIRGRRRPCLCHLIVRLTQFMQSMAEGADPDDKPLHEMTPEEARAFGKLDLPRWPDPRRRWRASRSTRSNGTAAAPGTSALACW